ncbi:19041_t:CDS:2, partial [Gigaspora margarita]
KEIVSAPPITNTTIDLYDLTIDQSEFSVVSPSESTDTSITPEIKCVEPIDDKPKFSEIIESVNDEPEISPDLPANNKLKFNESSLYKTSQHILTIAKIATSFVNCYKLIPQTSLPQLGSYAEELASKLSDGKTKEQARKARDQAKRRFQELGLSKEQADTLIPICAPGRHVDERDPIKVIVQYIIKNDLSPEEINGIAYDLASSAPTTVARNSRLNLLRKKLRSLEADYPITEATKIPFITKEANQIQVRKRILHGINGYDCP